MNNRNIRTTSPITLGIIPARGASTGVPRKNVCLVAGKPLIGWTIAAARQCPLLDRTIVSTDDEEIAEVARQYGAEVPFLRPADLALDSTPGILPLIHAVRWMEEHEDYRPDYVMLLQPTSPLRVAEDITTGICLAIERDADTVVSLTEVKQHPFWALRMDSDGRTANFLDMDVLELERCYPRRQDLPAAYAENGALYLVRRDILLENSTLYGPKFYGFIMPFSRSVDVDTPLDVIVAEALLTNSQDRQSLIS